MDFKWYDEISNDKTIMQGDIIDGCPIPIPNESIYTAILSNASEAESPIEIKEANLIIMSQACDLANNKLESVLLCAIWPLGQIMTLNEYYKDNKARESMRQGKEPSYHMLQNYKTANYQMDYSVVDFHNIYTLPKDYLIKIVEEKQSKKLSRLRLQPPYREHLSQAFARYFMRVGLPVDISRDEIKNYPSRS